MGTLVLMQYYFTWSPYSDFASLPHHCASYQNLIQGALHCLLSLLESRIHLPSSSVRPPMVSEVSRRVTLWAAPRWGSPGSVQGFLVRLRLCVFGRSDAGPSRCLITGGRCPSVFQGAMDWDRLLTWMFSRFSLCKIIVCFGH